MSKALTQVKTFEPTIQERTLHVTGCVSMDAQGTLPENGGAAAGAPAPPPTTTSTGHHVNGEAQVETARAASDASIAHRATAIANYAGASTGSNDSTARTAATLPEADSIAVTPGPQTTQQSSHLNGSEATSLPIKTEGSSVMAEPSPAATRGRPIGRPRGSKSRGTTRGSTIRGRGGKRKRAKDDDGTDTSDSEIITPSANTTKSGRNVQKPTAFVPPPMPSPTAQPSYKKRKPQRRNFESAVCKVCLRGVSPAGNMIVFCDACSTAYHRYCHHPPIDQSVIDEVDKEWYCRPCERERIEPVPEAEVMSFIPGAGASADERQKYFSTLAPGLLVTLLTRATTLHPDLPVFDPTFEPKNPVPIPSVSNGVAPSPATKPAAAAAPTNGTPSAKQAYTAPTTIIRDMDDSDGYGSDEHPRHYPRPGHGLMRELGPESADLHYLVDDENSKGVFTHLYREDQDATAGATPEAGR